MKILRDPSLSLHHTAVIAAIMHIFNTLGMKCVPFLPQVNTQFYVVFDGDVTDAKSKIRECFLSLKIVPSLLGIIRTSPMAEYNIQLCIIVSVVKQHVRNYLGEIFLLIQELWNSATNIQITLITLVEAIAVALEAEFKIYVPGLLPHLLQLFDSDASEKRLSTQKVLHALTVFGVNIEEYMHLVIPVVVKLFEKQDVPVHIRKQGIQTMCHLRKKVDFADHASRIIHPLARVLSQPHPELRTAAMDTLCALVLQMESDYAVFVPTINKVGIEMLFFL